MEGGTHHIMPPEFKHPANGVSDDGATEVTDMHLLRDIRTREVHHHALRGSHPTCGRKEMMIDDENVRQIFRLFENPMSTMHARTQQ